MTIKELYDRLTHEIEQGREDYDVKIITDNTSICGRASTNVKYASSGMDWESGQFNLVAEDRIMKSNAIELSIKEPKFTLLNDNPVELSRPLKNPKNPE